MKKPSRIMLSRIAVVFMASILLCAAMPAINIQAFSAQAASTTVTLLASDLIELGTEDAVCYEHGYHLPCQHCACFMAMAEAQGGVQYVRAASDGYYMLGFLQEGYLEPIEELDTLVINLFVLKVDFSGKVQWFTPVRALTGETSYPGDLLLTEDGGCIVVQKRYVTKDDLLYVEADRLDASGSLAWQKALTAMDQPENDPVNVGHDSWINPRPDGAYDVSWNTLQGEGWAILDGDGNTVDSGFNPEQTRMDSYKAPELQASYGEYSISVSAPVTRIIMTLEQPGATNGNPEDSTNGNVDGNTLQNLIPVLVDGIPVIFPDVQPFVNPDNRTLVPLRPALEAMGITVAWSGESNQALLSDGTTNVIFTLNSSTYMVDQTVMQMDTTPVVKNDRIMLPIRYAAEAFGATTEWQSGSVIIETH